MLHQNAFIRQAAHNITVRHALAPESDSALFRVRRKHYSVATAKHQSVYTIPLSYDHVITETLLYIRMYIRKACAGTQLPVHKMERPAVHHQLSVRTYVHTYLFLPARRHSAVNLQIPPFQSLCSCIREVKSLLVGFKESAT